ncbi:zinc-dependent metalloprotease [Hymenobacter sp. BT770]|uniref:zinc-dependent metalloprotease n=1 Tax=Hymenobacter sp. BT770 TaxID=2886942 RepID=UPI001D0FA6E4|nr:zinc-dependent metalloprotease [Hymenobacter sp. BT770]MCC3151509.1 zinc-dependent metalloprotease [Hymenobacter sp. BT770]MDO3413915.1 zinc-dependent metalloprotease [Hymenobacter sp. BT770]
MKKKLLIIGLFTTLSSLAYSQDRPTPAPVPTVIDSVKKVAGAAGLQGNATQKSQPKPYKTVITDKAITRAGFFKVHKVDDKYFFELADSVMGREILVVNRISKAGAEVRAASGYAGDQIGSSVIQFEKGPNNRVFLRKISFSTYSPDSTKAMYQAVRRSNIQAIVAAFNIAAYTPNNKGSVIDVTDYINGENEIFSFSSAVAKTRIRLGNFIGDRSYIENVRSFPTNVEVTTVKTYALAPALTPAPGSPGTPAPAAGSGPNNLTGSATIEVNTSLVVLPKKPMQPRYFDPRVGYFTVGYTDFDTNPQGVKDIEMVKRWRLEPKPQDVARYKRGELVEPRDPIVFYIDPATPKKWVPYLIAGVNDWQKAFEKAGFKNAIIGKVAPTAKENPNWSLDDARHSAIVYKPSEISNASGPSISDPRSGEIMESHINWYHNVMKLVHDWYMIQASAIDPRARKMEFSDELMGDLIRFVSSHEVGHTLGLRHNYGSSSTVPVENLRNKKWVEANGHTPSIMDYARFNYVAQPGDNITAKGIYPRIGDYDLWAIEWGYKVLPNAKSAADEVGTLNKLTVAKSTNRRQWFGTETNLDDPHSQNEDLGDNAMKASEYGIKNLQYILTKLPDWTREPNEDYKNLETMYGQLTTQYNRYLGHVAKNIGGIYENPKTVDQAGPVYERTPADTQKEALAFLDKNLFTTPLWLIDKPVLDNIGGNPLSVVSRSQENILSRLISNNTLSKLIAGEAFDGDKAYKITSFFTDINNSIFKEVKINQPIDVYRRNLQKIYVEKLMELIKPAPASPVGTPVSGNTIAANNAKYGDVVSVAKAELRNINALVKSSLPSQKDSLSSYHLQDISDRIEEALNPKG